MEAQENNPKKKEDITPIIDGDARPDINLHPEDKRDHPIPIPGDKEKGNTTKNRNDANSLEDYKDARSE